MFKEIFICTIIVIVIILGNIITQNYTKQSVEELSNAFSNLREDVIMQNMDKIKDETEDIDKKWEERHEKLAYYIEHNELEKIETELTTIKSNIETAEYNHSIESIDKCMFLLKHVQDRYAFNLENIF